MKKLSLLLLILNAVSLCVFGQENPKWEKKFFVTGYFALNSEYINNLPVFKEVKQNDIGLGIGEVGILTNIQPLEKLKINAVISYKPRFNVSDVISELSAEWLISEKITLKAGRFLLPLHPANNQFYAPLNIGVALPTFVTVQTLFPRNINGLNFSGKFSITDNIGVGYDFSGGRYEKRSRVEDGILGFFGRDGVYMRSNAAEVNGMIARFDAETINRPNYFGTGNKIHFSFYDKLTIEGAMFYSLEKETKRPNQTTVFTTNDKMFNYGTNLVFNHNNLNIQGAYWYGTVTPEDKVNFSKYDLTFITSEVSYKINAFTPYSKYDVIHGLVEWDRFTIGINYRPVFETTFKIEYHRYIQKYIDNFNVLAASAVFAF